MIVLAALTGALAVGGVLLAVSEMTRRSAPGGVPRTTLATIASPLAWSAAARRRAALALITGLGIYLLTRWPVGGIGAALLVLYLPKLATARTQRRRTAMLDALEQWTRRLSDMVGASRSIDDAIAASAGSAAAEIAGPVARLAGLIGAGLDTDAALREFAAEIADPAGDRIAAALIIATRRGAAAREVLAALADLLARDIAARREVDAEQAQHRTAVRWIGGFVAGFTAFAMVNRSYSAPYDTAAGQFVLAAVGALYAAGLSWLQRLGSLPVPGRFLDPADGGEPP